MARIDSLGEATPYHVPERKKAQKKERTRWRSFARMVEAAERGEVADEATDDGGSHRSLEELLDGVFAAGDRLKSLPTLETVRAYRQRVRAFLRTVVDGMLAVEQTISGAGIQKRKRFTLVRVIDAKLEALAASVLAAQREQLDILERVDEINGLLVDLVS
jgi:uncharacterized protein YaaR (DUF327 family)